MMKAQGKMIDQSIKRIIRNSFFYRAYHRHRIIKNLKNWSMHDQEMLEFYSQFVSSDKLCFDVGANVGNRVKIFLKLQANVVAIEPQNECVQILKRVFGRNRHLNIIQKALGEHEGDAEIMISNANTLSSLSPAWVEAVKKSGRFSDYLWDKRQKVRLTTLDSLVKQYGTPDFIKIDVEGFEYEVIRGLSQPIPLVSLEFVPERIGPTLNCIDRLRSLGEIRLNYSVSESMQFSLETWVGPEEMKGLLSNMSGGPELFGDVYVKSI
jgi:FkbM family methyltransferase